MYIRTKKILKRMLIGIVSLIVLIGAGIFLFMQQPMFGKMPEGARLERIKKSPNYNLEKQAFKNQAAEEPTVSTGMKIRGLWKFLFEKVSDVKPENDLPVVKTNLKDLPIEENLLIWFGHSSLYMQMDGKRILIDPVLVSGSPVSFTNKPFKGTMIYSPDDMPDIDYLVITHDHWDHLDYNTMLNLKNRTAKVICPLGVGAHFEYWGFDPSKIIELDWNENASLDENIKITALPSSHFSGRGLTSNKSLWAGYMMQSSLGNIYLSGDGGYASHFQEVKRKFGTIDLAIMENGQYNESWTFVHIVPEDLVRAIKELEPKRLMTVHNSKFALAKHAWYEPMTKISKAAEENNFNLITPKIGESVLLSDSTQVFNKWWKK